MLVTYLTGERVALRAIQLADKEHSVAWFGHDYAVNSERAEAFLKDELDDLTSRKLLLVIIRIDGNEVVGGVRLRLYPRHAFIYLSMAPTLDDADELRGEALKLLVPWLRDEGEHIAVTVDIAADQHHTIVAAEEAGMEQTARFREWYHRPGGRADRLVYQAIHPDWQGKEHRDA